MDSELISLRTAWLITLEDHTAGYVPETVSIIDGRRSREWVKQYVEPLYADRFLVWRKSSPTRSVGRACRIAHSQIPTAGSIAATTHIYTLAKSEIFASQSVPMGRLISNGTTLIRRPFAHSRSS